jgi:hypothetical protein
VLTFHNVFRSPSVFAIMGLLKCSQAASHDIKIIVIMPASWQAWYYEADLLLRGRVVMTVVWLCLFTGVAFEMIKQPSSYIPLPIPLFINSFRHSFHKCLISVFYILTTVVDPGDQIAST